MWNPLPSVTFELSVKGPHVFCLCEIFLRMHKKMKKTEEDRGTRGRGGEGMKKERGV